MLFPSNSDDWSQIIIPCCNSDFEKIYRAEPREVEVKVRMSEGRAIIGLISSPTFPIQWEITTRGQTLEAICWKWNYFFTLFNLQNLFSHNVTNHRGVIACVLFLLFLSEL